METVKPKPEVNQTGDIYDHVNTRHISYHEFFEGSYKTGFHYHGPLMDLTGEEELVEDGPGLEEFDCSTGDIDSGFEDYVKQELGRIPGTKTALVGALHLNYKTSHIGEKRLTEEEYVEQLENLFDIDLDYTPDPEIEVETRDLPDTDRRQHRLPQRRRKRFWQP